MKTSDHKTQVGVTIILAALASAAIAAPGQADGLASHNPGADCSTCHSTFKAMGTVFATLEGVDVVPDFSIRWVTPQGAIALDTTTNAAGNIAVEQLADGDYLIELGPPAPLYPLTKRHAQSRTWHSFPRQASCNRCHAVEAESPCLPPKRFSRHHSQVPPDNQCRHCHHYPATQTLECLSPPGVINAASLSQEVLQPSGLLVADKIYRFDPREHDIQTLRPDIFAPGYFSVLDAILALGRSNGHTFDVVWDEECQTHFMEAIDGIPGDYWYHFSYDAGLGKPCDPDSPPEDPLCGAPFEITFRRAHRWDELLWKPGAWVQIVDGEDMERIRNEYREEIEREELYGHIVPDVRFLIDPSDFNGNPPESHRVTVFRQFFDVPVTAHNLRAVGTESPYTKPFQPGVVTSMDILLSLQDQGHLNYIDNVFYTFFGSSFVDSYFVVGIGFPGVGLVHASGSHGFRYTTNNGSWSDLPNNANNLFHISADEAVLHAPDFSRWMWAENDRPFWESLDESP